MPALARATQPFFLLLITRLFRSRKGVLAEEDIVLLEKNDSPDTDHKNRLNWIVLNRADSNIATLSGSDNL